MVEQRGLIVEAVEPMGTVESEKGVDGEQTAQVQLLPFQPYVIITA